MTHFTKPLLGLAVVLALGAQPALAQKKDKNSPAPTAANAAVSGIAVANLDAAIVNSDAFRVASQQRQTTYKASYDQADTRAKQLEAQLKPMADKFQADRAANKPEAALVPQYQAIQQLQERGKQEIQQILLPVALSEAYVNEQIGDKLDQAVQAAMTKKGVTLVLQPQAVLARANSYELTPAIITELNTLVPTAQLVPPQGWLPREMREQRAAAQGQPAASAAQPGAAAPATAPAPRPATPAGPQPDGR
jgi:Skp family chaperone for outer membrane proteins